MRIINYQEEDAEKVLEFINRLRQETYGTPIPNPKDLENIIKNYHIFLVIKDSKNVIGTCGLLKTSFGGEIKRMYLDKRFRRKGLGRRLIKKIFAYVKQNNIPRIELFTYKTNKDAIAFYSKVGFRKTKITREKVFFISKNF